MTADEVAFAGGKHLTSLSSPYAWYELNSASKPICLSWWLLTPHSFFTEYLEIFYIDTVDAGMLSAGYPSDKRYIRPVLSISSCAKVTGTGTPTDPYQIDTVNSTC